MPREQLFQINEAARRAAEEEIRAKQHEIRYDLRDFTIDYIVKQFHDELFYVPGYQREFIWTEKSKCRFIESVILGLPIPMMFVADMEDGRLEIVDGAQRIQTLEQFMNNDLRLDGLERLPALNQFAYEDLPKPQQRKFGTKALRLVVLEDSTTSDLRQEIFDRVNTSGVKAKPSEVRRGTFTGPFMDFIRECARTPRFVALCPISARLRDRREDEELVLRFFAYSDRYKQFRHDVDVFLDRYAKDHQTQFERDVLSGEFDRMLTFVERHFPYGFAKSATSKATPRVRFEAIAVGVNLALRHQPDLTPPPVTKWLETEKFLVHTTTHASNSAPRLKGRIEFVRDHLLGAVR
jgi:uncharacterized protein with ParB-like and HNH nuclease domain